MPKVEKSGINLIGEAILKTVVFFDMFDCPLTAFEIWKYLPVKRDLSEVITALEKVESVFVKQEQAGDQGRGTSVEGIFEKNGYYFLKGRSDLYDMRMARYNFAEKKFKRAVLAARFFKIIPWIKLIAVGNIMGPNNAKAESDIDLFLVVQNRRVWLARFFCVCSLKILGWRPHINRMQDKICLSFFVSESALDLKSLMLLPERKSEKLVPISEILGAAQNGLNKSYDDIYFIYWLACLAPVFDAGEYYQRLIKINVWLSEYLPNWEPAQPVKQRDAGRSLPRFFYKVADFFLGRLENSAIKIQTKLFPEEIKKKMNLGTEVVVNEEVLKLHTNDRREYYRQKFFDNHVYPSND